MLKGDYLHQNDSTLKAENFEFFCLSKPHILTFQKISFKNYLKKGKAYIEKKKTGE